MLERLQQKGTKYRRSLGIAGLCCAMAALLGTWKVHTDYLALSRPTDAAALPLSIVVLDRDERLLRAFISADDKWRLPVDLSKIDPLYFDMLLAFEDKRFFEHGGVDARALLRAAVQSVRKGRLVSGGSTLTMQVARLLEERPTKSLQRKYEQILRSIQLEKRFTKEDILRLYVLRAPFGGNLEGVRAASLTWFGKEPGRLTAAEAALLVALPQSPETRRPDRYTANARAARNRVLAAAASRGVISPAEAASASAEPIRTRRYAMPMVAAHESRFARTMAPEKTVHRLTLDRDLQATLEAQARRRVNDFPAPVSLAVVVADHTSGEIVARIGAPDLLDEARLGHIDMTRAVRSPGSTLKPFIYGLAFEEGIGVPDSLIADRPISFGGYRPANFDRAYQGTVTLREALQLSLNTPAVQLLETVGPARLMAHLKRAGIRPVLDKRKPAGLAVSLGGLGLTLGELAQAYAALAQGGERTELAGCRGNCRSEPGLPTGRPVLSRKAAAMVSDILRGMPQTRSAETHHIAYKTGTSYGYRDAWAVGYDGRYVAAVWVGRPDGSPVPGQTGQKTAVPILHEVFQALGPRREPLDAYPLTVSALLEGAVPLSLRHARTQGNRAASQLEDTLSISYPPDGAELHLGFETDAHGAQTAQPIVVKFKGGSAPYAFLVNGRPHQADALQNQLVWRPEAPGYAHVTILDASGGSATVSFVVQ
ncbi:penicillin-binding protein 1C [Roseibium sp. MMSF_3412]|uniref:penicillin-binding protein 1C n=1 Tax=Roseibium sp. MMSF_3412 TaxID=3046712 RepID=UPI00273E885D|nr:penicillin-binding protein 1C [Roseibium sp. MMSF_3412]